ncbi:MAG: nitroreductase family protein [Gammaproteobacteria bacterium]
MEFSAIVANRHSVRQFEPGVVIDDAELRAIFADVILSPSSFNLQHWQFVVVRDEERKRSLRGLAYGQAQVAQCAAAILVCGRLDAHEDAARIYADAGDEARDKYVPMIEGVYRGQTTLQREEAIRSGALAAMSLMYAAKDRGWDSGPMIGFDAAKVSDLLALPEHVVPVMLVVLGKAAGGRQPPRGHRRPLDEVVHLEGFGTDSLYA